MKKFGCLPDFLRRFGALLVAGEKFPTLSSSKLDLKGLKKLAEMAAQAVLAKTHRIRKNVISRIISRY